MTVNLYESPANYYTEDLVYQQEYRTKFCFFMGGLLLCSYFYALPFIKMPWGSLSYLRLDDIFTVLLLLTILISVKNPYVVRNDKFGRLMIFIAIGFPISLAVSSVFYRSPLQYKLYPLWTTLKYLEYLMVFFLTARIIYSPRRVITLMWIVVCGGLFVSLFGLARYYGLISQYYYADMFGETGIYDRVTLANRELIGPVSPNHGCTAMVLGVSLIFAWALFVGKTWLSKVFLLLSCLVTFYAMVLTGARAPLYGLIFAILVSLLLMKGRIKTIILVICIVPLVFFLLVNIPGIRDRFFLSHGLEASTGGQRMRAWLQMFAWLAHNPLALFTGIGFGSWQGIVKPATYFNAAHNNYIHFLIEGGIFSLLIFLVA